MCFIQLKLSNWRNPKLVATDNWKHTDIHWANRFISETYMLDTRLPGRILALNQRNWANLPLPPCGGEGVTFVGQRPYWMDEDFGIKAIAAERWPKNGDRKVRLSGAPSPAVKCFASLTHFNAKNSKWCAKDLQLSQMMRKGAASVWSRSTGSSFSNFLVVCMVFAFCLENIQFGAASASTQSRCRKSSLDS